jgi:uncharacterized protein YmfQ (DUF2313 family)
MIIQKIAWTDQLQSLLPTGMLWDYDTDLGANIDNLVLALQSRLEVVEFDLVDLYQDLMPDSTSGAFLDKWEAQVGLPNDCSRFVTFTEKQRRENVLGQLNATGGQSIAYYLEVMSNLGYPTATITEFSSLRIGDECDDFVMSEDWDYTWQVNIPLADTNVDQFNAQSECDDSLGEGNNDAYLKCLMLEIKPAHTVLLFDYV